MAIEESTYSQVRILSHGSDHTLAYGKTNRRRAGIDPEFVEDPGDVAGHRSVADEQRIGDLLVGPTVVHQPQDLKLPRRQPKW